MSKIIDGVVGREGRYSNNPADPGGETMWGITKAVARANGYLGSMIDMPREVAVAIYTKNYVNAPGFNKIIPVSEAIAEEMIDSGVNLGPSYPGLWLQRTLNALNNRGQHYADIEVDGKVGPATINALKALLAKRGKDGEKVVLRCLNSLQCERYIDITEKRELNETFLFGWVNNRVEI